jgi:hypothetical protein
VVELRRATPQQHRAVVVIGDEPLAIDRVGRRRELLDHAPEAQLAAAHRLVFETPRGDVLHADHERGDESVVVSQRRCGEADP